MAFYLMVDGVDAAKIDEAYEARHEAATEEKLERYGTGEGRSPPRLK